MFANNTEDQLLELMKGNEALLSAFNQYKQDMSFFLSRMTHDIKNPLTLINSSLQLMEKHEPSITQLPYWNSVKADLKDLFSLLDQLRSFNYGDSLTLVWIDLEQLLIDINTSFEAYAREKNVRLSLTLSDNCHPYVDHYLCDPVKLKEAFMNLVKNAIEAAEDNSLVSIVCSFHDAALSIAITNIGSPIDSDDLLKIFTPFYTTKAGGTGLGIPTVHKIIAAHKGQLTVDSNEGKTTFTACLPIAK